MAVGIKHVLGAERGQKQCTLGAVDIGRIQQLDR